MWKKAYTILLIFFIAGLTYNWTFNYFMWFVYKKNAYEYLVNTTKGMIMSIDPDYVYMQYRLETLDRMIDDKSVMDSILIDLLKFKTEDGILRNPNVQSCAMELIRKNKRKHLQPYVDKLNDSIMSLGPGRWPADRGCLVVGTFVDGKYQIISDK